MTCPICNHRRVARGYITCGNSYCQEIRYLRLLLSAKSRRTKAERAEIHTRLNEIEHVVAL
jgi:hypothetical protein